MANFGKIVKELRNNKHMTMRELSRHAHISTDTVRRAEQMAAPNMKQSTYRSLAYGLGLSPDELDMKWRPTNIVQPGGGPGILVINRALAGTVVPYEECRISDSGSCKAYIDRGGVMDPNAIAVIVTGDSMSGPGGQLLDGDYCIFVPMRENGRLLNDSSTQVEDGHVVFARFKDSLRYNGSTMASIRRLSDGNIELVKSNPKYRSIVCPPREMNLFALYEMRRPLFKGVVVEIEGPPL